MSAVRQPYIHTYGGLRISRWHKSLVGVDMGECKEQHVVGASMDDSTGQMGTIPAVQGLANECSLQSLEMQPLTETCAYRVRQSHAIQGGMVKAERSNAAQQEENKCMAQTNDISLCEAVASNQHVVNGFPVIVTVEQNMQLATMTANSYSEAQRMQPDLHQLLGDKTPKEDLMVSVHRLLEARHENGTRPLPLLLRGKEIDLLRLCSEVTAYGGCEKVTETAMWSDISENLGFGQDSGSTLKLVYVKYLKVLEGSRAALKNGLHPSGTNVDLWAAKSVEESCTDILECDVAESDGSLSPDSSDYHQESNGEIPSKRRRLSYFQEGHAVGCSTSEQRVPISKGADTLAGVIEWVRRLALNPGDPKKGQGPRGSKQNEAWVENCLTIVIKMRAVLWGRKELIYYGNLSGNTTKQRIPPALYYKELPKPNKRTLEKLRANQTRAIKCGLDLSGNAFDVQAFQSGWLYQSPNQMFAVGGGQCSEQGSDHSSAYMKSMSEALSIGYLLNNKAARKRIPIGVHFQCQIPPWTGKAEPTLKETDGWLSDVRQSCDSAIMGLGGSLVWPLLGSENMAADNGRVGRGRPLTCVCANPMSIECVRLHVLEEREKMKGELGDAFNSWGFNDMGETVSGHWTKYEELAFDLTVKMNPLSLGKNFWDELPISLPSKTINELVSYYFNVFVVRRRALENRMAPESIDSDDDERELLTTECDSAFGDGAGIQNGKSVDEDRTVLKSVDEDRTVLKSVDEDRTVLKCFPSTLCREATLSMSAINHPPYPLAKDDEDLTWIERKL